MHEKTLTLVGFPVGDFLSAGVGLMWTLSSSSMVPSISNFGSSISADSDFLGTEEATYDSFGFAHVKYMKNRTLSVVVY